MPLEFEGEQVKPEREMNKSENALFHRIAKKTAQLQAPFNDQRLQ